MATTHSSPLLIFSALCLIVGSAARISFRSQNPIRPLTEAEVENGLINFELFNLLGGTRQAFSFARFAVRYVRYRIPEI